MKSFVRVALATVAVLFMAGCAPKFTAHLSPNPNTSAELRALALSAKTAPPGFNVLARGPIDDRQAYARLGGGAKPECRDLDAISSAFVFGGTPNQPVGATAVTIVQGAGGPMWVATERLVSYTSGNAHFVIQDLTDLATACAGAETAGIGAMPYTTMAGPALGDESLRLTHLTLEAQAMEADTIIIRSGDNLIIVEELPRPQSQRTPLDVVAAAAYRAFTG
jgi:hypothetical protein